MSDLRFYTGGPRELARINASGQIEIAGDTMIETIDPLIIEVHNAPAGARSALVLVTGIADRLAGITHPAEAHAFGAMLAANADAIAVAVVEEPDAF
jgi:hypothetical protein